jgi:hypothetical protein
MIMSFIFVTITFKEQGSNNSLQAVATTVEAVAGMSSEMALIIK